MSPELNCELLPYSLSQYFPFFDIFGGKRQAFAMQSCARCGFVVYPAEKINCIDQVNHWAHWELKRLFQIFEELQKKGFI